MRLIDADKLPHYNGYSYSALETAHAVESAPTVDAVPMELCRSCVYREIAWAKGGKDADDTPT